LRPGRVRAVQSHGEPHERVGPGHRVALNLNGIDHTEVQRGDAVVTPERWRPTRRLDASLEVLASLEHEVSRRGAYVAYIGAGEFPVQVRVLGANAIMPGERGLVRLHLSAPLPLLPGDRYVLRESGRAETVGGGEVLDVAPVLPASRARPDRSVDRVVAERGWVEMDELEPLTGERRSATIGRWVVDPAALAATATAVRQALDRAGPLGLDVATLDEHERAVLPTLEGVVVEGGRARAAAAADPLAGHPYVAALEAAPFSPPEPAGVDRAELRELVRRGVVVERDGCHFTPSAEAAAGRRVARVLESPPDGVTVAQDRDPLGTTRKHRLPPPAHRSRTRA